MRDVTMRRLCASLLAIMLSVLAVLASAAEPTPAARWNQALLDAVKTTRASDVVTARALAIVHTAMFDAWACYDDKAIPTQLPVAWRRPAAERNAANKQTAISYAAYGALLDLFPSRQAALAETLRALGYDPAVGTTAALDSPANVGALAARHVVEARRHDGANQKGDWRDGVYSDWTNWRPVNPPDKLVDPRRFQPPSSLDAQGQRQVRNFGTAHFALVRPFALETPWEFRPQDAPITTGSDVEARRLGREILDVRAKLDDVQKATAEVWALDAGTETPPGYWAKLAQHVALRRNHGLDDDVRMFFALGTVMLDAAVATMDAKVAWNGARPEPLIAHYFADAAFKPYLATSASPEQVSGHSSFGAAGATVLALFTGSTALGYQVVVPANSLKGDRGPAQDLTLRWDTLDDAADAAGWSRVYGGIHFTTGDRFGRALGAAVARKAWHKAQSYFGSAS
jgi:hypothetical protein